MKKAPEGEAGQLDGIRARQDGRRQDAADAIRERLPDYSKACNVSGHVR